MEYLLVNLVMFSFLYTVFCVCIISLLEKRPMPELTHEWEKAAAAEAFERWNERA